MPATLVVDLQHGDTGKGRIIDYRGEIFDLFARFGGSENAGHTVVVKGVRYALHYIPSGVVRGKKVAIGNGCVINPASLLNEIRELEDRGLKVDLVLSERAHVISQRHIDLDKQEGKAIGTTAKGVGPAYTDKVARKGKRIFEVLNDFPQLRKYVGDVSSLVNDYLDAGKNVLLEGAQGFGLDIDHGTYPYVTSSSTTAGGACTGLGLSPKKIDRIIGVAKAYYTRVGRGPHPTELGTEEMLASEKREDPLTELDFQRANEGDEYSLGLVLRKQGGEYGTTTGRPRRCGWFDSVVVRKAARINGVDEIAITKLDVLRGIKTLKICDSYKLSEKEIRDWPVNLDGCRPHYMEMPGWPDDINNVRRKCNLPHAAIDYLDILSDTLGNPKISMIGVGPERDQMIELSRYTYI